MSIAIRKTVLAIVPETTEGELKAPTAATQYTAPQTDWTMDPGFNTLENDELSPSIGARKPIIGSEDPTASGSHYLRASGAVGTAPDYNDLLKGFFGNEVIAATEYDTVAGSTTTAVNVDVGEGVNFQRGQGLLIKDALNGWRIRTVHSVATDTLSLGFTVPTAPAASVNLGRAVLYSPAESGHQTMSIWRYIGNGGNIEAEAGALVTKFAFSANAAELPNASFDFAALSHYYNPIIVTATTRYIDWTDSDGTWSAAVEAIAYKDPQELAAALQSAMRAANSGETPTVTYSNSTGKFTFTNTNVLFTIKWNTGANTANSIATKVGFTTAADSSAAVTYTSPNAYVTASPFTPTLDVASPFSAKNQEVMIGDSTDYACFNSPSVEFDASLERAVNESLCARSGRSGAVITGRTATVKVKQFLDTYDSKYYARLQEGTSTRFQFSFGEKVGGQWVPGKVGCLYIPNATVSSWAVAELNGLAVIEIELTVYVADDLLGEMYLNFL